MDYRLDNPAENLPGETTPEYGPLGLNHTLRIDGLSYIYDPERRHWVHDDWTPSGTYAPDLLSADEIHALILEGRFRVLPWTEDAQ